MYQGVDDHFADRLDGDRVDVAAPHFAENRRLVGVLEQELNGAVDSQGHGTVNLGLVEDIGAVRAAQAPALDPGGGEEACGIGAGGEDARIGGDDLVALCDSKAERQQVGNGCGACAQLGKDLQIQVV